MSVHSAVHEAPAEGKEVDQETRGVLLDHQVRSEPNKRHVNEVRDDASLGADSVDNLGHQKRADHLTDSKDAQSEERGDKLVTFGLIRDRSDDNSRR